MPSAWSSRARTCCWWTTPSCAARPAARSWTWPAPPAQQGLLRLGGAPVRFPNVYGIDMPTQSELIATGRNDEEIARAIGADSLVYQDLHDMQQAVRDINPKLSRFERPASTASMLRATSPPSTWLAWASPVANRARKAGPAACSSTWATPPATPDASVWWQEKCRPSGRHLLRGTERLLRDIRPPPSTRFRVSPPGASDTAASRTRTGGTAVPCAGTGCRRPCCGPFPSGAPAHAP